MTSLGQTSMQGVPIQLSTGAEPEWHERALCAQTDPEAFFPEKGGSTREAKRICLGCEVKDACLDYALAHDERFPQRASLQRSRALAFHHPCRLERGKEETK